MREGRPSATAYRVAERRAVHQLVDRPPVFTDPLALRILSRERAAALQADPRRFAGGRFGRYLRAFLAARSRYAEDELARAVERGIRQYVVLGAGLDTFAYRSPFPAEKLRVFEVDHPDTQAWKRQRLAAGGIAIPETLTFAPVDFESQTLAGGLQAAGFRAGVPTFFSWLGVTPYLTREAVMSTLAFVAGAAGSGGAVVFDYGVTPSRLTLFQRLVLWRMARRVRRAGEPWRTSFDPEALARDLASLGYRRVEDLDARAIDERYFRRRQDGLRVGGLARLLKAEV